MIAFAKQVPEKTRAELEAEWAERDRIWLLERDWCKCRRAIPDRVYLKHLLCRRCSRWVRRLIHARAS